MAEYFEVAPERDLKSMDTFLENWDYYEALKKMALENKTIDGYKNGRYRIKKRTEIESNLKNYRGIFYNLEVPLENEYYLSNKLLVFFMPADATESVKAEKRIFGRVRWDSLSSSIAKNTYILRIADSNLITGSYYQNTKNFPDYEALIQELIEKTAQYYEIELLNITCYGNSRGGTGALYHGLLGNYKVLATDPVIDRRAWVEVKDMQHMFDLVDYNFASKINQLLQTTTLKPSDIKILSSDSVFITYPYIKQLEISKLSLLNIQLKNPHTTDFFLSHALVIGKTVPLQLSLINELLYENDIETVVNASIINTDDWDVLLPWNNPYFDLHYREKGLQIIRNKQQISEEEPWLNFMLKIPLEKDKTYVISISGLRAEELDKIPIYVHSLYYYERVFLFKKSIKQNEHIYQYAITPKKRLEYFSLNALDYHQGDSIIISSLKINKQ